MSPKYIADELNELSLMATVVAKAMLRYEGNSKIVRKGRELADAARLIREWAEGIREEIAENE